MRWACVSFDGRRVLVDTEELVDTCALEPPSHPRFGAAIRRWPMSERPAAKFARTLTAAWFSSTLTRLAGKNTGSTAKTKCSMHGGRFERVPAALLCF